jgi:hypothetical protein
MKKYAPLTPEQVLAVQQFASAHGRTWKQALRDAWMAASEPGTLQALRNSHGPSWLISFKLPPPPVSYAPEVIADSSGKWCGNALRFATYVEALASARDLSMRWTAVREWRAIGSNDPVNYRLVDGVMEAVR